MLKTLRSDDRVWTYDLPPQSVVPPRTPTPRVADRMLQATEYSPALFVGQGAVRFELSAPLAEGGEARFRMARRTNRYGDVSYVAVKTLRDGSVPTEELEAMVAARSPLDAQVYTTDTGVSHLVMRLGDNHLHAATWDIHDAHVSRPAIEAWAINVLWQVSKRLDVMHTAGFAHRDLKPQNIFVTLGGEILVGDFGSASKRGWLAALKGTPGYMSPDMLKGSPAVRFDDVWMLGVTALVLIMDATPFDPDREHSHLPLREFQRRCDDIQRQEMDGYLGWRTGRESFLSANRSRLASLKKYNAEYFAEFRRRAPRLAPLIEVCLDPNANGRPLIKPLRASLAKLRSEHPVQNLAPVWRHVQRDPNIAAQMLNFAADHEALTQDLQALALEDFTNAAPAA
jgi:serine/threonine protein kinase